MNAPSSREEVRRSLCGQLGGSGFPEAPPLNLKVLSKRTFLEYEEWKIEYDVEGAATMPAEAGRRAPAYLLIPRHRAMRLPAMVCFHQCAVDCTVAKEAVVGKGTLGKDQGSADSGLDLLRHLTARLYRPV